MAAAAAAGSEQQAAGPRRPSRVVIGALTVLLAAVALQLGWTWAHRSERVEPGVNVSTQRYDFDYVVPAGTADRLRAGEKLTVMPSVLRASVGDVIRIVNNDDEAADIGPFRVPARATLTQRLTRKGTFVGFCVLSPTGRSQLVVT